MYGQNNEFMRSLPEIIRKMERLHFNKTTQNQRVAEAFDAPMMAPNEDPMSLLQVQVCDTSHPPVLPEHIMISERPNIKVDPWRLAYQEGMKVYNPALPLYWHEWLITRGGR